MASFYYPSKEALTLSILFITITLATVKRFISFMYFNDKDYIYDYVFKFSTDVIHCTEQDQLILSKTF